jgi:hypothetical protein
LESIKTDTKTYGIGYTLKLSEAKIIRNRTVYSFLTMVSEISGFADLFVSFTCFIFGTFYSSILLETNLLNHMGPVDL